MRVLIDVGHPGDFYLFKNFAYALERKNNVVVFTVREGESETIHLDHARLKYFRIGKKRSSFIGKIFGIFIFSLRILLISVRFKPSHFVSHGSIFAGIVSFILRKPHIALEDTGNMEQIRLSKPLSNVILSSDVLPVDLGKKHIRYRGYHELCYLSPKYFTPNRDIFNYLNISEDTPYAILRFVSWKASHDIGQKGLSDAEKISLVTILSTKMKVFISSEQKLTEELEKFRINIPVFKMHDALAFANIYVGEGATMASESGILGTPAIYISTINISYTIDQEKYGTVFNFNTFKEAISKINELVNLVGSKSNFKKRRAKILDEKIDVTSFLVWFVENYPESFKIMKVNPDYQYTFKS
jgi:predicted glycosyltransferase